MFLNHQRPISISHARTARQQQILVRDVGVGVNRDRGNMQLASHGAFVQRLNVFQLVFETIAAQIDFVRRHRVKHERVVGIG